jgi:hypothetical protein
VALKTRKRLLKDEGISSLFFDNTYTTQLINTINGDTASTTGKWPSNLRGFQITESEGHPFWPRKSRPDGDVGGPFKTRKVYVRSANSCPRNGQTQNSFIKRIHTNGYLLPAPYKGIVDAAGQLAVGNYPDYSSSDETLNALGAEAISLCSPVNPVFDASTAVAEIIREGLPTITGLQLLKDRRASSIGGEYLNYQLGSNPLSLMLRILRKHCVRKIKS